MYPAPLSHTHSASSARKTREPNSPGPSVSQLQIEETQDNLFTLFFICAIFFVCVLWIKFYSQVKEAYINFLNHCYIDTEVEMKEIYTSNHMWSLFERSFLVDMGHVANATHDRKHADTALENYIINSVMNIISTFFNSPFSDQSTTVQVGLLPFPVKYDLLRTGSQLEQCSKWLSVF